MAKTLNLKGRKTAAFGGLLFGLYVVYYGLKTEMEPVEKTVFIVGGSIVSIYDLIIFLK